MSVQEKGGESWPAWYDRKYHTGGTVFDAAGDWSLQWGTEGVIIRPGNGMGYVVSKEAFIQLAEQFLDEIGR